MLKPSTSCEIASFFRDHVSLLRGVPDPFLRAFASRAVVKRFPVGHCVCRSGEPAREVSFVREGRLLINQRSPDGNLQSIGIMVPGDVAGLMAVASPVFLWDVVAAKESVLIALPLASMRAMMAGNPSVAQAVLNGLGRRLQYVETLLYYSRERVDKRLIVTMIHLHRKFGATLPLTRAEIGQLAGTTPETAMRMLRRFEERGLLERHRGKIVIKDLAGLKAHLGLEDSRL